MTFARVMITTESSNLDGDETVSLIDLSSDRNDVVSGGFFDNWDDSTITDLFGNSPTPFKIHYYHTRVSANQPCVIWSSDVENLRLAKEVPSGVDTAFTQRNVSSNIIKKWTLTQGGFGAGIWAHLGKKFTYSKKMWNKRKRKFEWKRFGSPRYYNNAAFKVQIKNLSYTGNDASYRAITELGIEYDATSSG